MVTATRWWHKQDDQIVCDLCPRECALHEGQRGFCFVRQNVGGEMVLTTYGRSSGFCVDPIEKKPLNHFLPGTPVLSFGTAGCNLGCKFCQNWSISKAKEFDTLADAADPAAIAKAAKAAGCRSVAFTYNDPVIWAEYAIDAAIACHEAGLKTVAVTAGYISPEARKDFYAVMDSANVDLKAFTETFYKYLTLSKLEPVLDTLRWLKHESNVWFEITNLMIPGENDSAEETERMCDWILRELGDDVPVHFTAFHPDFRMKDRPPTPPETLQRARQQALKAGIKFPYVGNTHDVAGQSTYCPNCKSVLIERDWYQLGQYNLRGNACAKCGTIIPGVFEQRPGDWGPKRMPVRISAPSVVQISPPSQRVVVPSGPVTVSSTPSTKPMLPQLPDSAPLQLSDDDGAVIVAYARAVVEATLLRTPLPAFPDTLAGLPTYGIFVTLRRAMLRSCKGRFGDIFKLGDILSDVAIDAATHDPRFPSLVAEELPRLRVEVSLMHGPQWMTARGDERIRAIQVGKHGLVLHHPRGRGLLLPQVATEQNLDAYTFLRALSQKAGLPHDAWRDDAAQIMTFEASILHSKPPVAEFNAAELSNELLDQLAAIAGNVLREESRDAGGLDAALTEKHASEIGMAVRTSSGRLSVSLGQKQSLAEMVSNAGRSLRQSIPKEQRTSERIESVSLMWQPIPLSPRDFPDRHQTLAGAAIVARRNGGQWGLHVIQSASAPEFNTALQGIRSNLQQWGQPNSDVSLTAFSVRHHVINPVAAPQRVNMIASNSVRPAARAGQFYPADPAEMSNAISRALAEGSGPAATYRAIMLPHAGWMYCGSVIGKTLARTVVPRNVIIVGPKHTPLGANWSVSSADKWEIPGATVPIATEIRDRLLQLVPALTAESDAHQQEHGIEVLVPFLLRMNPELRIVPIVLGPTAYSQTHMLARALSIIVAESSEPPLLVISSDMNHFAAEAENRRLDQMALDAMCTGDAGRLFDTVQRHNISMCGVMPAVAIMRALSENGATLRPELVHYTNSGLVTGQHDRVVGYAGVVIK